MTGLRKTKKTTIAVYGVLIILISLVFYVLGIAMAIPRRLFFDNSIMMTINYYIVWYSGIPFLIGITMVLTDIFIFVPKRRRVNHLTTRIIKNKKVTVVLTAYNDEESIGMAIKDFKKHKMVKRVIVVSNNSKDRTIPVAKKAGAIVVNEPKQGYGNCVYRSLSEGIKYSDTELILLCEGDMTFRSYDIDKFLSYIDHADVVNGSRIVEQLREENTQLSTFMFYGNYFVGKLLEIKHLGMTNLSDVGTTYKLCRKSTLQSLLPKLDPNVNLEFNPYFIDKALNYGYKIVECPITFYQRVGFSKGGNSSNYIAFKLGMKMIFGILFWWKEKKI